MVVMTITGLAVIIILIIFDCVVVLRLIPLLLLGFVLRFWPSRTRFDSLSGQEFLKAAFGPDTIQRL